MRREGGGGEGKGGEERRKGSMKEGQPSSGHEWKRFEFFFLISQ